MNEKDRIRRMVLVEGKSIRAVAREHSRNTIPKMLENSQMPRYTLTEERGAGAGFVQGNH